MRPIECSVLEHYNSNAFVRSVDSDTLVIRNPRITITSHWVAILGQYTLGGIPLLPFETVSRKIKYSFHLF